MGEAHLLIRELGQGLVSSSRRVRRGHVQVQGWHAKARPLGFSSSHALSVPLQISHVSLLQAFLHFRIVPPGEPPPVTLLSTIRRIASWRLTFQWYSHGRSWESCHGPSLTTPSTHVHNSGPQKMPVIRHAGRPVMRLSVGEIPVQGVLTLRGKKPDQNPTKIRQKSYKNLSTTPPVEDSPSNGGNRAEKETPHLSRQTPAIGGASTMKGALTCVRRRQSHRRGLQNPRRPPPPPHHHHHCRRQGSPPSRHRPAAPLPPDPALPRNPLPLHALHAFRRPRGTRNQRPRLHGERLRPALIGRRSGSGTGSPVPTRVPPKEQRHSPSPSPTPGTHKNATNCIAGDMSQRPCTALYGSHNCACAKLHSLLGRPGGRLHACVHPGARARVCEHESGVYRRREAKGGGAREVWEHRLGCGGREGGRRP